MEKILIIDDDLDTCSLLSRFLSKKGFEVKSVSTGSLGIKILEEESFAVVLCDFRLGDMDGREVLAAAKRINEKTQVIIITGYSDVRIAVEVIQAGAFNYVTKPLLPEEILINVKKAIAKYQAVENFSEKSANDPVSTFEKANGNAVVFDEMFIEGKSNEAVAVYKQIDMVGPTNYCVIIYGETGTGKESAARRIHEKSNRSKNPFVAVDCGALSKELAGSELFGHEKGAFTGAVFSKVGSFEIANGGTLLLDEVANLSYEVQVMLLRVIQEKKMKRIGGIKDIDLDVRLIVASNESLTECIRAGKFREDLYHRFNEFTIVMPNLRDRNIDILLFAEYFLGKANTELGKKIVGFHKDVEEVFLSYGWPGNLRELNNVIRRCALLSDGKYIDQGSLPLEVVHADKFNFNQSESSPIMPELNNLKSAAFEAEHKVISETLKKVKYNKSQAARLLNVDRKTLYNKMKLYNIHTAQDGNN